MSNTKRKLIGLLTLGTATVGTVSSGVTSAAGDGFFGKVKKIFNRTDTTTEMKKSANTIIDSSRGYGAAINLASVICELGENSKNNALDILETNLSEILTTENNKVLTDKKGNILTEDKILEEKGNSLLKIAYDLGISTEELINILEDESYISRKEVSKNNTEIPIVLYDKGALDIQDAENKNSRALLESKIKKTKYETENKSIKALQIFNLFLPTNNTLGSAKKSENDEERKKEGHKGQISEKQFKITVDYCSDDMKNNIKAVKTALENLSKKIFDKLLEGASEEELKQGISAIMQIICRYRRNDYFKEVIKDLMEASVSEESDASVKFSKSKRFETLMKSGLSDANTKDNNILEAGKREIKAEKDMLYFSNDEKVLVEVLRSLGYGVKSKILDNQYVRTAIGVGATLGLAYFIGAPVLSAKFACCAFAGLLAARSPDLRKKGVASWVCKNVADTVQIGVKTASFIGSVVSYIAGGKS